MLIVLQGPFLNYLFFPMMLNINHLKCRFIKQYLLLFLVNQMASALFRLMAALGRNMILAMNFGGFALLVLFALGGFVLARSIVNKLNEQNNLILF